MSILDYIEHTNKLLTQSKFRDKICFGSGCAILRKKIHDSQHRIIIKQVDTEKVLEDFYSSIEDILNKKDKNCIYTVEKQDNNLILTINKTEKIKLLIKTEYNMINVEYMPLLEIENKDLEVVEKIKNCNSIKDLEDFAILISAYKFRYKSIKEMVCRHKVTRLNNELKSNRASYTICKAFLQPFYTNIYSELTWNTKLAAWIKNEQTICNDTYNLKRCNIDGLIGVEAATSYWGMSTFNPRFPIFLSNDNTLDNEGDFIDCGLSMLWVPNVNYKNTVKLSNNLSITDREQTVCDMIRYKRQEFHLYETVVSAYEDGEVNIERLESLAKQYGILKELKETYEKALEVIDEG